MCNAFVKSLSDNALRGRSAEGTTHKKAVALVDDSRLAGADDAFDVPVQGVQPARRHAARHAHLVHLAALGPAVVHAPLAHVPRVLALRASAAPCLQDVLPQAHHAPAVRDPLAPLESVVAVAVGGWGIRAGGGAVGREELLPPHVVVALLVLALPGEGELQLLGVLQRRDEDRQEEKRDEHSEEDADADVPLRLLPLDGEREGQSPPENGHRPVLSSMHLRLCLCLSLSLILLNGRRGVRNRDHESR